MTHNFVYEECHKKLQKRKEDIIPKNCKLQEKKTYLKYQVKQQGAQITCILVYAKLQDIVRSKTIGDTNYLHPSICKVARNCKEEEKTYQTLAKYCMKERTQKKHLQKQ